MIYAQKPPKNATIRFLKAYFLAISILLSYWWFFTCSKFFGPRYKEDNYEKQHKKTALKIEKIILELQGLFIKVGQLFSVMTNFLPQSLLDGLENMQDAVPASPYEQVKKQIYIEFNQSPSTLFASFDENPIACASLGQVHKATTHEGIKVAVKVRHQDIEETASADLLTIWRILKLVKRFVNVRGLENYYYEIKAMVLEELDFEKEAQNLEKISHNFKHKPEIIFPGVHKKYSGKLVLTLDYIDGYKISDISKLREKGFDTNLIAKNLMTAYCQMIFVDGIYHADPHPGNIRITEDGNIALLDFGAVGILSDQMRNDLGSMMEAIIRGDEDQLLRSLKSMGFIRIGSSQTDIASRVIEHFHKKFQEEIKVKDFSLSSIHIDPAKGLEQFSDLKEMNIGIGELSRAFHIPREWVLLERTALQLTGICTQLDHTLKPATIIRPYLEEFVLGKDRDLSSMLFDLTKDRVISFLSVPRLIEKYVNHIISSKLVVKVDKGKNTGNLIYLGLLQLSFFLMAMFQTGVGLYFEHTNKPLFSTYSFYSAIFFAIMGFFTILKAGKYKK